MDPTSVPRIFDPSRHRRRLERAAPGFGEYDFLKARLSSDLAERLEDTSRRFGLALDLGCHDGALGLRLLAGGRVDRVIATDPAPAMARRALGEGLAACAMPLESLSFGPDHFDLVASAFALHWVNDLPGLLIQIRTVLKPDGLFLGALAGAGTLQELRNSLLLAESEIIGGAAPRVSPLPGLQDLAGLMQRAGFAMPVADIETITVRYPSIFRLFDDLRGMGETAAFAGPEQRALSRRILMRAGQIYAENHSDPDGRLPATFKVVWLSGWAPAEGQPKPLRPGSAKISLTKVFGSPQE